MCDCEKQIEKLIDSVFLVKKETLKVKQELELLRKGTSLLDLKQEVSSVNHKTGMFREDVKEVHETIKKTHQSIQQLNKNTTDLHKDSYEVMLLISSIHLILLALILFKLW